MESTGSGSCEEKKGHVQCRRNGSGVTDRGGAGVDRLGGHAYGGRMGMDRGGSAPDWGRWLVSCVSPLGDQDLLHQTLNRTLSHPEQGVEAVCIAVGSDQVGESFQVNVALFRATGGGFRGCQSRPVQKRPSCVGVVEQSMQVSSE